MKKNALLLFLVFLSFIKIIAQEVEYVIKDPKKSYKPASKNITVDTTLIPNPDYTSYFLNSTAYTLEKKKIRLSGTDVIFMKASYGITDNTTLSVNISLFGTFTGSIKQQINLTNTLKLGISASVGRLFFISPDSMSHFGGAQANITIGDRQNNITFGTGIYYVKSNFDLLGDGEESFISNNIYIGFQKQLGKKTYLMAEGMYFLNYDIFTGALGLKFIIGNRVSLSFGVMPFGYNIASINKTVVEPIPIPLISFRYLLGKNR